MVGKISFLSSLKLEKNRHYIVQRVTTVISLFFPECYSKHFQSKTQCIITAGLKMTAVLEKTNVHTNLSCKLFHFLLVMLRGFFFQSEYDSVFFMCVSFDL